MLAQVVEADLPLRAGRRDVSVLRADALAGRRVPVVEERGVVAPVDRPEERVAQRLPANRGRPVHREEEAGCAVLLVDRVVHDRQIQHRNALHLEERVGQERVLFEVQDHGAGCELPSRRRLHARGEAALGDPVFLVADLRDLFAVEVDVRLLSAKQRLRRRLRRPAWPLRGLILHRRRAGRVEERAGLRLSVVFHPIGGDAAGAVREHDVARRDHLVGIVEPLDLVSREGLVVAVDFDLSNELPMVLGQAVQRPLLGRLAVAEVLRESRPRRAEARSDDQAQDTGHDASSSGRSYRIAASRDPHVEQSIDLAGQV